MSSFQSLVSHFRSLRCGIHWATRAGRRPPRRAYDFLKVVWFFFDTIRGKGGMNIRQFDAKHGQLPAAPKGTRLVKLTFESCPGSSLAIHLAQASPTASFDHHGITNDAWWKIECSGLPDRYFRTSRGSHSISELLRRYGFQDSSGCVNHRRVVAHFAPTHTNLKLSGVPEHLRTANGVPQFYPKSGVCWFCAMCWTSVANDQMRELISSHIPDEDLRHAYGRSIFERNSAETFRKRLWNEYKVGDNVDMPAEMDGQNGFSQFSVMAAKLGIPMYRLRERHGKLQQIDPRVTDQVGKTRTLRTPKEGEPHILAIRFQDGDHQKFPMMRRVTFRGQRYRFVGAYMGQRKCGHQIGMASPTGDWRDWSIADADLHKDGIGPIFIRFDGDKWRENWWKAWGELVHVTKFGMGNNEFCSLSPHNPPNNSLDKYRGSTTFGTNSIDMLYLPA